jgi:hypothetical protein
MGFELELRSLFTKPLSAPDLDLHPWNPIAQGLIIPNIFCNLNDDFLIDPAKLDGPRLMTFATHEPQELPNEPKRNLNIDRVTHDF